jgi:hypothetical protein
MRSTKLITVVAVASALLMLSPAGASARHPDRKHASSPLGSCRISLFAEPHAITSGESVQVFGQLQCTGPSDEGQTVTVYQHTAGVPAAKIAATLTTGAGGFFSLVQPNVVLDTAFYATGMGATSPTRRIRVAPVVTVSGPSEAKPLFTGFRDRVTFNGTVSPTDTGATIVLQRENATSKEEWHLIQLGVVGPGGVYSITHDFHAPGDANLRIVVRRHGGLSVRGFSPTLSYGISQKENPNLTIHTSAYSVAYGSPVTLSGILAGGAGKVVTLESHTAGKAFATVTTATTTPGDEYKFVVTALADTAYRVTSGGLTSTVLFEGVKYILTAGVSTKTVQSGQPVTFAGTVTPANVGKTVYLERENPLGGGFHVADVGTVAAGGTYSITHYVFGSGKPVFRVKVPGDPSNQQTSGETFQIEVTSPKSGALKPVLQPKVPTEGTV